MNLYVYGFVLLEHAPGRPVTVDRHRIELLAIGGIHVAIERLAAPPAVSESALRAQHAIVERLARQFAAVLPARFGSFVPLEDLERIVRARRRDLRQALRKVQGRVQMTLRIFTPPSTDRPIPSGDRRRSGTAYLTARRAALSGPRPPVAAVLTDALHFFVHDERSESDSKHGRTALFHLIDRADVRRYRAALERLPVPEGERVTVTGPFPPFAFAPELWA
jgi:uncharacterized protein YbjT (DUF2867 family)